MGDRQYEFTEPLVQELITICIQVIAMRDEVLVQLMKQLTDNPNSESIEKGWELLFFLIYCFPPSDDICNYLIIFVRAHPEHKNLEKMFALAGSWEAVLLVDEADVFLESRTSEGDANRNALVSVLLRVLEYYQGIMILTTNRITSLDVAVQSRIHLAIRYEDLTKKYKTEIFKMFLKQLEPDSIKDRDTIIEWIEEYGCDAKLNGREIRNVVKSALARARSMAKLDGGDDRLTVKHLKAVVNITKDFQEQLDSVTKVWRSHSEAPRASK